MRRVGSGESACQDVPPGIIVLALDLVLGPLGAEFEDEVEDEGEFNYERSP